MRKLRKEILIQGPQWGLVGSPGLGGLNLEGSEGFQAQPGPWEPPTRLQAAPPPPPLPHVSLD